ncbi:MAG: HAMP domain-containing protein, partial [Candidatus Latescibacteria bacterium]|nr:HAMP domain-containing protein [Candidatus Latescibacterota bacterium]
MKINIGPKLIGGFIIVALIVGVVGVIGLNGIKIVGKSADVIMDVEMPIADASMELQIAMISARDLMGEYLLENELVNLPEIKAKFEQMMRGYDALSEAVIHGGSVGDTELIATDNEEIRRLMEEADSYHSLLQRHGGEMMEYHRKGLERAEVTLSDEEELARSSMAALDEASEKMLDLLVRVEGAAGVEMAAAMENADSAQSSSRTLMVVCMFVAVGLAAGIGVLIARSITGPVTQLRDASLQMAQGNTDVQLTITSQDELGELARAFEEMGENIRGIVAEMGTLAESTVEGKLDVRGDAAKFGGDFAGIVQGVNNTLDAVIGPLNMMAEYVDRISKGDIPENITDEYK